MTDEAAALVESSVEVLESAPTRLEATARMVEPRVDSAEVTAVRADMPADVCDRPAGLSGFGRPTRASCRQCDHLAMAQLIVRNVDDEVVRRLKRRAADRGRSAEAEHREILREALAPRRSGTTIKDALLAMPCVGDDAEFERSCDRGRKVRP